MERTGRTILVTGATGQQGGAVARHLTNLGWQVRALTRQADKPASEALSQRGIGVAEGDLEDRASLDSALEGVYGVFSVQDFWEHGYDAEVLQGKNLADAAKAHGIQHLVYNSVGGADRDSGIAHFESKWEVEEHIRSLDIPHTIFRPVWFMDNFVGESFYDSIRDGVFSMGLAPDVALQMIDVNDIGGLVALAFENPDTFLGEEVEIAGDELTGPQMATLFGEVMGHPVRYEHIPMDVLSSQSEENAAMFRWFNEHGYEADIPALREIYPPLATFAEWLRETGYGEEAEEAGAR